MAGYDVAVLVGLGAYVLVWVFAGEAWVSHGLEDYVNAYERHHRKRVLFRRDLTRYNEGWKFLTGTVEPGRVWSKPQTDPELEAMRQRWLSRRRVNFLGALTTIVLVLVLYPRGRFVEIAVFLPYVLAVVLSGYFMWPDLSAAWKSRRKWFWRELLLATVALALLAAFWIFVLERLPVSELANVLPYALAVVLVGYFLWPFLPRDWFGRKVVDGDADVDAGLDASARPGTFAEVDESEGAAPPRISRQRELLIAVLAIPLLAAIFYAFLWSASHF